MNDHEVDKVCYICPHCNVILFVDKAKEVFGVKWCPNCGMKMDRSSLQEETWNEEWTRQ